jgi:cytochrome c556
MKRTMPFVGVILALIVGLTALSRGDEAKDVKALMKRKLTAAQKVLEGVALNDNDAVAKHADELITISKQAEWKVLKTPQYELYSNEFRRTAESLVKQAKAKNSDGVALAYVELTLNCVKCHKHVRETRMARLD